MVLELIFVLNLSKDRADKMSNKLEQRNIAEYDEIVSISERVRENAFTYSSQSLLCNRNRVSFAPFEASPTPAWVGLSTGVSSFQAR